MILLLDSLGNDLESSNHFYVFIYLVLDKYPLKLFYFDSKNDNYQIKRNIRVNSTMYKKI